jgi:hypothetical protein
VVNIAASTCRAFSRTTLCAVASGIFSSGPVRAKTPMIRTPRSPTQDNKAIVERWFTEFWGQAWNPESVDERSAPDILIQVLLQAPHRGRADMKAFMTSFREACPDELDSRDLVL